MNIWAIFIIFALAVISVGLLYALIQQRLNQISERLNQMQTPGNAKGARQPDDVRRDLAAARDHLALLEARLVSGGATDLLPEDIEVFENARKKAKASVELLKQYGDWLGLPFDLEWTEIQARLPRLDALYRKAVEAEMARLNDESGNPS